MNERQLNLPKHEDFSGWKRPKTRLTAVTDVAFHSTHRKGYQSKLLVLLSKATYVICEAYLTAMTGDRHDELAALDHSMIAVALTLSWLVCILTVMPVRLYFSSFLFCSLLFFNTKLYIYYTSVSCVWFLLSYVSLQSELSVKTLRTRTVHFVFSLRIFVSAHVIITSITAPGMFTNLCLVLLLLFADSPVPKFRFQLKEKN